MESYFKNINIIENYLKLLNENPEKLILKFEEKEKNGTVVWFEHIGYTKNIGLKKIFFKPHENHKYPGKTINEWKSILKSNFSEESKNENIKLIFFRNNDINYNFDSFDIIIIKFDNNDVNNITFNILFEITNIKNEYLFNTLFDTIIELKNIDKNKAEQNNELDLINDSIKLIIDSNKTNNNKINSNNLLKIKKNKNELIKYNLEILTGNHIKLINSNNTYTIQNNFYFSDELIKNLIKILKNKEIEILNNLKNNIYNSIEQKNDSFVFLLNELNKNNQLIIYGTAGLGKSHSIKSIIDLKKEKDKKEYSIHRTVFHPEFSYYDFVGKILPITNIDNNKNKSISYNFEPGIFTKAYNEAINNEEKNIYLVIDEINRGYTTGIFGDIFLLLDRENNESSYEIEWSGLQGQSIKYNDMKTIENHKIKLPKNFYIIGTMNTSDKTTIKLDKAFERRFNKYFISLAESIENLNDEIILESNKNIKWKDFLTKLNNKIKNDLSNNFEDIDNEFIGSYFIKSNNNFINITDIKYSLMYHLWYSTYSENKKSLTDEITFEDFINKGYQNFINKIIES